MLTDTFTAKAFFSDYTSNPTRALRWMTLRQDSGDPFVFAKQAKQAWVTVRKEAQEQGSGETASRVRLIFSDGLDVEKAIELQKGCDELEVGGELGDCTTLQTRRGHGQIGSFADTWFIASFGIGTFLTNDFNKASHPDQVSKPLNIVIKLNQIDGKNCVKLSDDKGKVSLLPNSITAGLEILCELPLLSRLLTILP
jgi:nicotinate phosphoribosyltransferase